MIPSPRCRHAVLGTVISLTKCDISRIMISAASKARPDVQHIIRLSRRAEDVESSTIQLLLLSQPDLYSYLSYPVIQHRYSGGHTMHTRSQTKRANDATPLVSLAALAAEVKVPSSSLVSRHYVIHVCMQTDRYYQPKPSQKTKLTQGAKKRTRRPQAPKIRKIVLNLPWETHSEDLIRIARDEIARLGMAELAATKSGRRKGPFLCQCCWKPCRGSYELGRHYGTHLLDKIVSYSRDFCPDLIELTSVALL